MKYHVLSAIQTENFPISLVGKAILFEDFKQIDHNADYSYFPWYSIETCRDCQLPKHGVLVIYDDIKITLRKIKYDLYVVNEKVKKIIDIYIDSEFYEIKIFDDKSNIISDSKYYIFRFNLFLDYKDFLDIDKSIYRFNDGFLILEKIFFLENLNKDIFKIKNIDPGQDTLFISEKLRILLEKIEEKGFKMFDITIAKWRDPDDFMRSLFLSDHEINDQIWPI